MPPPFHPLSGPTDATDPAGVAAFSITGARDPQRPVIIAVPHAGRHYPPSLLDQARAPMAQLRRLEDRYADALAGAAAAAGFTVICANVARALIDLNRAEDEWDAQAVAGLPPPTAPNQRVRAGLGLIPARLHPFGALWLNRIDGAELERRIVTVHRPYHQAVAQLLGAARARFGGAMLIDLHSMPTQPNDGPQMVLGDRYGLTASSQLVDTLLALGEGQGLRVARNSPYAGAHGILRHADPVAGVEAVQVEIDRALYLDTRRPDPQRPDAALPDVALPDVALVAGMMALVTRLAEAAEAHVLARTGGPSATDLSDDWPLAAE